MWRLPCIILVALPLLALGGNGVPDDIRVGPFVMSKWGQTTHDGTSKGTRCFNRHTPHHYYAGCTAVAFAQVMRFLRYPEKRYDWSAMPLNPLFGVTDVQADAIGTLLSDAGKSFDAQYTSSGSYALICNAVGGLKRDFGFAQAELLKFETGQVGYSLQKLKDAVVPNCDYGSPVVLSVGNAAGDVHDVVVDGYGYSNDVFCVHVRCGCYGEYDGWFVPPKFKIEKYAFDRILGISYNLLPRERGTVVSGRVYNPDGTPADGASVLLEDGTGRRKSTQSKANGIYAFVVANPGSCKIVAAKGACTAETSFSCRANVSAKTSIDGTGQVFYLDLDKQVLGNSCGHDIRLKEPVDPGSEVEVPDEDGDVVPPPVIVPSGGQVESGTKVSISNELPGVEIRYTLDGSSPTETSPLYVGPIVVSGVVVMVARAWKEGMVDSSDAVAVFTPKRSTVAKPTLTVQSDAGTRLAAKSGTYAVAGRVKVSLASSTSDAVIRYTLDGSEPTGRSPSYSKAFYISDSVVLRARAWKDGWLTSEVTVAKFAVSDTGDRPAGDEFDAPMLIGGFEGSRKMTRVSRYTLDDRERCGNRPQYDVDGQLKYKDDDGNLRTDGINYHYEFMGKEIFLYQYHSAWLEWKAPASGRVNLAAECSSGRYDYNLPLLVVVYRNADVDGRAAVCVAHAYDEASSVMRLSFDALQGDAYRIGLISVHDLVQEADPNASYKIEWSMSDYEVLAQEDGRMDLSQAEVVLSNYSYAYTGKARYPKVKQVFFDGLLLRENVDYTYAYMKNVDVGTSSVLVSGCGEYKGVALGRFSIYRHLIVAADVMGIGRAPYAGSKTFPEFVVRQGERTLVKDVDYTVSCPTAVTSGFGTAVLTGIGSYRGTVDALYEVVESIPVKLTLKPNSTKYGSVSGGGSYD